jgi:sirohydrochlorin ferrochelatase
VRALVLAAHGSADPGYPAVFDWIVDRIVGNRPDLAVRVGYLDHCQPRLATLPTDGDVVVPMLLSTGHHLTADIPRAAPNAVITAPIGPDPRLATVVADRLRAAGWSAGSPVVLATAGSRDARGIDDVHTAAAQLAELTGVEVTAAFAGAGEPKLDDVTPTAVATYLLAPGHFADLIASCGAPVISAPLGPDPRVADVVMSRYDAAVPW